VLSSSCFKNCQNPYGTNTAGPETASFLHTKKTFFLNSEPHHEPLRRSILPDFSPCLSKKRTAVRPVAVRGQRNGIIYAAVAATAGLQRLMAKSRIDSWSSGRQSVNRDANFIVSFTVRLS